jgi:hypothetical protein
MARHAPDHDELALASAGRRTADAAMSATRF